MPSDIGVLHAVSVINATMSHPTIPTLAGVTEPGRHAPGDGIRGALIPHIRYVGYDNALCMGIVYTVGVNDIEN